MLGTQDKLGHYLSFFFFGWGLFLGHVFEEMYNWNPHYEPTGTLVLYQSQVTMMDGSEDDRQQPYLIRALSVGAQDVS